MTKPRILVVEDQEDDANELKGFLESNDYEVTEVARNLKDALGYFYSQQPDMAILDIYLNGIPDGITFAQRIQENPNTARPFIFLTSHADMETFRKAKLTMPFSYLLKPYNQLELQYAIELAIEKFTGDVGTLSTHSHGSVMLDKDLFIKNGSTLMKVPLQEIEYIEVEGKYSSLVTNDSRYLVQQALKKMEEKLIMNNFIRIHRNYIINIQAIKKVQLTENTLYLKNDKPLPISSGFRDNLISKLDILR